MQISVITDASQNGSFAGKVTLADSAKKHASSSYRFSRKKSQLAINN
jgi:hypothetical protein